MNSNTYELMDEPKGRMTRYAVTPIILLFVSMFIPKPFQLLMPLAFLINAWLMGCYDFKKQVKVVVLGAFLITFTLFAVIQLFSQGIVPVALATAKPYIGILFNAGLFALLYKLLIMQNSTYALIKYIREQQV